MLLSHLFTDLVKPTKIINEEGIHQMGAGGKFNLFVRGRGL